MQCTISMWIYENIQLLSVWNEILKTSKNVESYCKREWTECFNARLTEVSARFIWEFASLPHKFFPEHLKLSREVDTTAFVCTYVLKKRGNASISNIWSQLCSYQETLCYCYFSLKINYWSCIKINVLTTLLLLSHVSGSVLWI